MYRDLPSGIKRLPRSLSSILVQGTECPLHRNHKQSTTTKVQVGIATCTNARNLHVGEAWAVGGGGIDDLFRNENNSNQKNESSPLISSLGYAQVGVLDSRENRAFEILNSPRAAANRDWNEFSLMKKFSSSSA